MLAALLQYVLPALALGGGALGLLYLPGPLRRWALLAGLGLALFSGGVGMGYRWADRRCAAANAQREAAEARALALRRAQEAQAAQALTERGMSRDEMIRAGAEAANRLIDEDPHAPAPATPRPADCAGGADRDRVDPAFIERLRQLDAARQTRKARPPAHGGRLPR